MERNGKGNFLAARNLTMKTGFLLPTIVCILLLTSYAAAQEFACNVCHGNPPIYDNVFGGPNGLVDDPRTGATSAGAHAQHVATSTGVDMNPTCYECHFGGMPYSEVCGNNKLQIGFNNRGIAAGGSYDGHALNQPYSYEGTNSATVTMGSTKVCSSIYCHSDGTAIVTKVIPAGSKSPAWDSKAGPPACNACHGYPPSYPQMTPKANKHGKHAKRVGCQYCHYPTTTTGNTITNTSTHANGVYDVAPTPGLSYGKEPVSFTYRLVIADKGGYCDNVSCHGGGTAFWGK